MKFLKYQRCRQEIQTTLSIWLYFDYFVYLTKKNIFHRMLFDWVYWVNILFLFQISLVITSPVFKWTMATWCLRPWLFADIWPVNTVSRSLHYYHLFLWVLHIFFFFFVSGVLAREVRWSERWSSDVYYGENYWRHYVASFMVFLYVVASSHKSEGRHL